MPKISIIVPVYNVEQYLPRCIDSILAQTFTDFELLLIDDGSTDNSDKICDEYAEKDERIRVLHKENGGVSSARQMGIENIHGQYFIYVDSDDWIDLEMLQMLYFAAKEKCYDIVWCDMYVNRGNKQYILKQYCDEDNIAVIKNMMIGKIHGSTCNKLVKSSLLNDICFSNGNDLWEDINFNIKLFYTASNIKYLPKAFYHYAQNESSYTHKITYKSFCQITNNVLDIMIYLKKKNIESLFEKEINYFKLNARNAILSINDSKKNKYIKYKDTYSETNKYINTYPINKMKRYMLKSIISNNFLIAGIIESMFLLKRKYLS